MTDSEAVRAVAALDDPQRAKLYAYVRSAGRPVTREDAADAVGISRKLAAFHLDRLVDAGLVDAGFDRPAAERHRVGRAPKRYQAARLDVIVSIPERRYDLLGEMLLDAVVGAQAGEQAAAAAERVARTRGLDLGERLRRQRHLGRLGPERAVAVVTETMEALGFEPAVEAGVIVQRNCPFHRLAQRAPELVCGMNCQFVAGLIQGLDAPRLHADLAPSEGRCCVIVAAD